MLDDIAATGKLVIIKRTDGLPGTDPVNEKVFRDFSGSIREGGQPGEGSDSLLTYSPTRRDFSGDGVRPGGENLKDVDPVVVLGHELVHAQRNARGQSLHQTNPPQNNKDEQEVIGLQPVGAESGGSPGYDPYIHENKIRKDFGIEPRTSIIGENHPYKTLE